MKKVIALCLLVSLLYACGVQKGTGQALAAESKQLTENPSSTTIFAMDTVMELTTYGGNDELLKSASDRISQLEALLSTTDENSEIYQINHTIGATTVSEDTTNLVKKALQLCSKSKGSLDISIYPVIRAWGFTTDEYQIPEQQTIDRLLAYVDYKKVILDEMQKTVSIPEGMEIDLGCVAKGYAGDEIIELFHKQGIKSAIVNLGGNVQTLGTKQDGTKWKVAIRDPESSENLAVISVADKAVITSGGYERFFKDEEGNIYGHIMDPSTGAPADSGLISVTVVADSGLYADSLSTSLFVMGLEEATEFWRTYRDFEAVFVKKDGGVYVTEGLKDSCTLTDSYKNRELTVIKF